MKLFYFIFLLFQIFLTSSFSYEFKLTEIANFNNPPWGSTFINSKELLVTEKKVNYFLLM